MARIVLSALVSDIRGKLAGSVVQGGSYGLIIKGNKWRCNSQYKAIGDWKIKTGNVFHLWGRLTATEKSSWKTAAAANPVTRPDGSVYKLTGYMYFTKTNLPLAFADQPLLHTPGGVPDPRIVSLASLTVDYTDDTNFAVVATFNNLKPSYNYNICSYFFEPAPIGSTRPPPYGDYGDCDYNSATVIDLGQKITAAFGSWAANTIIYGTFQIDSDDAPGYHQNIDFEVTSD